MMPRPIIWSEASSGTAGTAEQLQREAAHQLQLVFGDVDARHRVNGGHNAPIGLSPQFTAMDDAVVGQPPAMGQS
jgi:hypothetical protein